MKHRTVVLSGAHEDLAVYLDAVVQRARNHASSSPPRRLRSIAAGILGSVASMRHIQR